MISVKQFREECVRLTEDAQLGHMSLSAGNATVTAHRLNTPEAHIAAAEAHRIAATHAENTPAGKSPAFSAITYHRKQEETHRAKATALKVPSVTEGIQPEKHPDHGDYSVNVKHFHPDGKKEIFSYHVKGARSNDHARNIAMGLHREKKIPMHSFSSSFSDAIKEDVLTEGFKQDHVGERAAAHAKGFRYVAQTLIRNGTKKVFFKSKSEFDSHIKKSVHLPASSGTFNSAGWLTHSNKPINEEVTDWVDFGKDTGTLGIPREEMPQIQGKVREKYLSSVDAEKHALFRPIDLKPTQKEYSPGKVQTAREFAGQSTPPIVSLDGHVVDGHHRYLVALQDSPDKPIEVVQIPVPILDILAATRDMPTVKEDHDEEQSTKEKLLTISDLASDLVEALDDSDEFTEDVRDSINDLLDTLTDIYTSVLDSESDE